MDARVMVGVFVGFGAVVGVLLLALFVTDQLGVTGSAAFAVTGLIVLASVAVAGLVLRSRVHGT